VKTYILSGGGGQIAVAHVGVAESLSHRGKNHTLVMKYGSERERERERERESVLHAACI
jgi:hypothetical protein